MPGWRPAWTARVARKPRIVVSPAAYVPASVWIASAILDSSRIRGALLLLPRERAVRQSDRRVSVLVSIGTLWLTSNPGRRAPGGERHEALRCEDGPEPTPGEDILCREALHGAGRAGRHRERAESVVRVPGQEPDGHGAGARARRRDDDRGKRRHLPLRRGD